MAQCKTEGCEYYADRGYPCQRCIAAKRKAEYDAMSPQEKLIDDFAWAVSDGARMDYHDDEAKQMLRDALNYAARHLDGLMFVEASDKLFDLARALDDQLPSYMKESSE